MLKMGEMKYDCMKSSGTRRSSGSKLITHQSIPRTPSTTSLKACKIITTPAKVRGVPEVRHNNEEPFLEDYFDFTDNDFYDSIDFELGLLPSQQKALLAEVWAARFSDERVTGKTRKRWNEMLKNESTAIRAGLDELKPATCDNDKTAQLEDTSKEIKRARMELLGGAH
jgi:hypothetical protein